jgi:hypothetical protein
VAGGVAVAVSRVSGMLGGIPFEVVVMAAVVVPVAQAAAMAGVLVSFEVVAKLADGSGQW